MARLIREKDASGEEHYRSHVCYAVPNVGTGCYYGAQGLACLAGSMYW